MVPPQCEKGDYILAYDEWGHLELETNPAGSHFLHFMVYGELEDRALKRKKMKEWFGVWETVKYYLRLKGIHEVFTLVPTDDKRATRLQRMFGFEPIVDFDEYIMKLAVLTGTEKKAKVLLKDFNNKINNIYNSIKDKDVKVKVFFESTENNYRTVTEDSMPGNAVKLAGGISIAENVKPVKKGSSIASYGAERILLNADKIEVYIAQKGVMNPVISIDKITKRPGFNTIKAVKENKIMIIDEAVISRPTFRYAEGVKILAEFFYDDINIK